MKQRKNILKRRGIKGLKTISAYSHNKAYMIVKVGQHTWELAIRLFENSWTIDRQWENIFPCKQTGIKHIPSSIKSVVLFVNVAEYLCFCN